MECGNLLGVCPVRFFMKHGQGCLYADDQYANCSYLVVYNGIWSNSQMVAFSEERILFLITGMFFISHVTFRHIFV